VSYPEDLARELAAVGIGGRLRHRIVAEVADHLECDPQAALGAPGTLARQFADELGMVRTRRAVWMGFSALVLSGVLVAAAFLTAGSAGFFAQHGGLPPTTATRVGTYLTVVGGQVAFAAAVLAVLGLYMRGRGRALARSEAIVLHRRIGVAIVCGLLALAGLALLGIGRPHPGSHTWVVFTIVGAGVGAAGLLTSVPALVAALGVRPPSAGDTGDIFEDLGPLTPPVLLGRPWLLATLFAGGLGVAIALLGVAKDDPFDGILRGLIEAALCLGGFALLGPFLGLWTRRPGTASAS
jgi:hypothetical protein